MFRYGEAIKLLERARHIHLTKLGAGPTKTLDDIDSLMSIATAGFAVDSNRQHCRHLVVLSDPGRDLDDECAIITMAALSRSPGALVECKAFIATLSPVASRARLARGTLDTLGLHSVPVGLGSHGGVEGLVDDFSETSST